MAGNPPTPPVRLRRPTYDPQEEHYRSEALRELEACLRDEPYEFRLFDPRDPRNTPLPLIRY